MAIQVHTGNLTSHEPAAVADNIRIATQGFPFTDPTESSNFGLRDKFTFTIPPFRQAKDIRKRDKVFDFEMKADWTFENTEFSTIRNAIQRTIQLNDAQWKIIGGSSSLKWVTMKENSQDLGDPADGSSSMAFHMKYTVNNEMNVLEMNGNAALTLEELIWLYSQSSTQDPGNSGGTSGGMAALAYDFGSKKAPGIHTCTIENSGGSALSGRVGLDSEITIETMHGKPDGKNRALAQELMITGKITIIDFDPLQLKAYAQDTTEDMVSVTIALRSGQSLVFNSGAVSVFGTPIFNEEPGNSYVELNISGTVPVAPTITDVNYYNCGIADANVWSFELVGYN